jgi:hypothetical protein
MGIERKRGRERETHTQTDTRTRAMPRIPILFELLLPLRLDGLKGAAQLLRSLLHLTPVQAQGTAWGWRDRER